MKSEEDYYQDIEKSQQEQIIEDNSEFKINEAERWLRYW